MATETVTQDGAVLPTVIRTARKRHACNDCMTPILPGDKYELTAFPPHSMQEYDVDRWMTWRTHYPRWDGKGEFLAGCAEAAAYHEKAQREATCTRVAVVGDDRYPCCSHEGGKHHFAAHWPACPAPFCKLPPGHRGLHDIPSGHAEVVDTSAA